MMILPSGWTALANTVFPAEGVKAESSIPEELSWASFTRGEESM